MPTRNSIVVATVAGNSGDHSQDDALAQGAMNPEAGVAATRPEMVPEHQPTSDHYLGQTEIQQAPGHGGEHGGRHEFQQAIVARRLAPKAEPPLKP